MLYGRGLSTRVRSTARRTPLLEEHVTDVNAIPREFVAAFELTAADHPERIALIDGDVQLSYGRMAAEVTSRATRLSEAGVRAGDRVALVAENSVDQLVCAFAILKGGAVLVTIYPSSGHDDLTDSLASADPVIVLADGQTVSKVRSAAPLGLPVAEISGDLRVDGVRLDAGPNPTDLREPPYLICYSSGTTARPKAITLSRENVFHAVETYAQVWRISAKDTTVVALPMTWLFGLATSSMTTLLRGGTVVILRRARPERIIDAIVRHRATILPGVTTMFTKLVSHLESLDTTPDLASLRLCVSGGEPRNEPAFERWTELTGCPVHDTFCASECAPLITYDPIADPVPVKGSAGKLVPGSLLRVVDEQGRDVAPGEVGEVLANGPGLFSDLLARRGADPRRGHRGRLVPPEGPGACGRPRLRLRHGPPLRPNHPRWQ